MKEKKYDFGETDGVGRIVSFIAIILVELIGFISVNGFPIFLVKLFTEDKDKSSWEMLFTISVIVIFLIIGMSVFKNSSVIEKYKALEEPKPNNNDLFQIYNKIPDFLVSLLAWFIPTNFILGVTTRLMNKNYLKALLNILVFPLFFLWDQMAIVYGDDNCLSIKEDTMNIFESLTSIAPRK